MAEFLYGRFHDISNMQLDIMSIHMDKGFLTAYSTVTFRAAFTIKAILTIDSPV